MELGIVGLPASGKTMVFNAATRGNTSNGTGMADRANVGSAKIPDSRLNRLKEIFQPPSTVQAEVRYIDIPGVPQELGGSEGIAGQYLNMLERVDALVLIVRAFKDDTVAHPLGSIDPHRDLATMQMELAFADLNILERRLKRLTDSMKSAKTAQRDALKKEENLINRLKETLESENPIRGLEFTTEETKILQNYQFLTAKPLMVVWNIDEGTLDNADTLELELRERYGSENLQVAVLCGKIEVELAAMELEDEIAFRESLGIQESGLNRMISLSSNLLGLMTFLTAGPQEVRAWTIPQNIAAVDAAGKIHTDIKRGFIRAEVVHFSDIDRCGSFAEAKKQGVLRLEGKTYLVQDGDVITFRFNI